MSKKLSPKHLFAGSIISCLEWYEYSVFGYFADIIGHTFLPHSEHTLLTTLYSFAILAIGFLFRPLGSILFGMLGDTKGRKFALITSLLMLGIPSLLLAFLPSYAEIGSLSIVALILIRILQGLAISGNYGGSFIFLIEHSPKSQRGFASSCAALGVISGLLLGSASAALISYLSTQEFLYEFGWRIPYLASLLTVVIAYYFHKKVPETQDNDDLQYTDTLYPLKQILTKHKLCVLKAMSIITIDAAGIYTFFLFIPHYLREWCGIDRAITNTTNTIGMLFLVVLIPIFGKLSDHMKPLKIIRFVSIGLILLSFPIFYALNTHNLMFIIFAQIAASIIMAACYASVPITVVSIFPKKVRFTGTALSFNLCLALVGGPIIPLLIHNIDYFGNNYIPAIYLSVVGIISGLTTLYIKIKKI